MLDLRRHRLFYSRCARNPFGSAVTLLQDLLCLFTRLSSAFPPFVFVLCSSSPRSPILGGLGSLNRIICVTWRILSSLIAIVPRHRCLSFFSTVVRVTWHIVRRTCPPRQRECFFSGKSTDGARSQLLIGRTLHATGDFACHGRSIIWRRPHVFSPGAHYCRASRMAAIHVCNRALSQFAFNFYQLDNEAVA